MPLSSIGIGNNGVSVVVKSPTKIVLREDCRAADMKKSAELTGGSQQDSQADIKLFKM